MKAWKALSHALFRASFDVVALAAVAAENDSDHSKRGKESLLSDLVIECRPKHKKSRRSWNMVVHGVTNSPERKTFESKLLCDGLPLVADGHSLSPSLIERASGVLAAHLPQSQVNGQKSRLIFVLPNATQSLGRFLAVSLLLADFVKRKSGHSPILGGDLLLVTQHIRNCVDLLRDVAMRHRSEKLPIAEFWPIEVLSQYAPAANSNPRVFGRR
jgi:hypothetical protein